MGFHVVLGVGTFKSFDHVEPNIAKTFRAKRHLLSSTLGTLTWNGCAELSIFLAWRSIPGFELRALGLGL